MRSGLFGPNARVGQPLTTLRQPHQERPQRFVACISYRDEAGVICKKTQICTADDTVGSIREGFTRYRPGISIRSIAFVEADTEEEGESRR